MVRVFYDSMDVLKILPVLIFEEAFIMAASAINRPMLPARKAKSFNCRSTNKKV